MLRLGARSFPPFLLLMMALVVASCTRDTRAPAESSAKVSDKLDSADKSTDGEQSPGMRDGNAFVAKDSKPGAGERGKMVSASDVASDVVVETERPRPTPPPKLPPPDGATRLDPDFDVWLDPQQRAVIVDGNISLREGLLEMFACLRGTKEHESIISANTRAYLVHAGLVGLGADPGTPVEFMPTYKPPTGPEIEILVQWIDEDGNEETVRAQELIKDVRAEQAMSHPFVFAGSLFWDDPDTDRVYYMAEQGDFICVSNFGTAMIDIPVESSQSLEQLAFAAFTERIPPLGTPVRMILKPKLNEKREVEDPPRRDASDGDGKGELIIDKD